MEWNSGNSLNLCSPFLQIKNFLCYQKVFAKLFNCCLFIIEYFFPIRFSLPKLAKSYLNEANVCNEIIHGVRPCLINLIYLLMSYFIPQLIDFLLYLGDDLNLCSQLVNYTLITNCCLWQQLSVSMFKYHLSFCQKFALIFWLQVN